MSEPRRNWTCGECRYFGNPGDDSPLPRHGALRDGGCFADPPKMLFGFFPVRPLVVEDHPACVDHDFPLNWTDEEISARFREIKGE